MFKKLFLIITCLVLCSVAFGEFQHITYVNISNNNTLEIILRERLSYEGNTFTFANAATIDNATNGAITFTEAGEDLIWTFTSNKVALSSSTGLLEVDFASIFIEMAEISAPGNPGSDTGRIYVADVGTVTTLFFKDSVGTETNLLTVGAGNTLDASYDEGGAGVGRTIDVDTGVVAFTVSNTDNNRVLDLIQNDTTNNPITLQLTNTGSGDTLQFVSTGGNDIDGSGSTWSISSTGAITADTISVTTLFENAIVAASGGNVNLTIDAAGNGTILVGNTSTGAITLVRATSFTGALTANGAVTLGDASTDDITITGDIIANVTLDDDTTDSPSLTFRDAGEDNWVFLKANGATGNLTATSNVGTSDFQIITGNLKVGAGSESATLNGDDAYITGTFEVDGAARFDGTLAANGDFTTAGNLTATLGATELYQLDAATTDSTTTGGVLDIDIDSKTNGGEGINVKATFVAGGGGSEVISAIVLDLDDDSDAAGTIVGLDIAASDVTGSSAIVGIRTATSLETAMVMNVGAANKAITIDAASVESTQTTGVVDIEFDSKTDNSEAVNIKATFLTGAAGVSVSGMEIELANDSSNASDILFGIIINVTDSTATGKEKGILIKGAGIDAGIQLDTGYIRIGTGSSPDVAPGDDDLYIEGTIEVDGAARFDGAVTANSTITGDGGDALQGFLKTVTNDSGDDGATVTAAESGIIHTNFGSTGLDVWALPAATGVVGAYYTFAVVSAQIMNINPDGSDQIIGLTNATGDSIQSSAPGDVITLVSVATGKWFVVSTNNSTNNADSWADAN